MTRGQGGTTCGSDRATAAWRHVNERSALVGFDGCAGRKRNAAPGVPLPPAACGVDSIPIEQIENKQTWPRILRRIVRTRPREGAGRGERAPTALPRWSAGRRRPPTSLGGARLARRAPDPLVRRALRHWARRLPALHPLVSRGTEKGDGWAGQPEKTQVAGRRSARPASLPGVARRAKPGARRASEAGAS